MFRQIVWQLLGTSESEPRALSLGADNIFELLEAAWLLECPRIFDEVVNASYTQALSSRQKVELLEHILPFTQASSPLENQPGSSDGTQRSPDEFMRILSIEASMWQKTERAALSIASQLDSADFVLGPRLATGSLLISIKLLRMQQRRAEEMNFVASALQPMSTMWKNLTDRPLKAKVTWSAHHFALTCIRRRLDPDAEEEVAAEHEKDAEARADIAEVLCDVSDGTLLGLGELVCYVQVNQLPPNWVALLIRALLLGGRMSEARPAFAHAFPGNLRVQEMAWRWRPVKGPLVPALWLADVAVHREASEVLLRLLGRYSDMGAEEFCCLVEDVLLRHFLEVSPYCHSDVLASVVVDDIVAACFAAARRASASGASEEAAAAESPRQRCPAHWVGEHAIQRLVAVGSKLFHAAFLPQCGFLPHRWPQCPGELVAEGARGCLTMTMTPALAGTMAERGLTAEELPCHIEPLIVRVEGHCLWDEGLLGIGLLQPVAEEGRNAPSSSLLLHHVRQVVMRHLWQEYKGQYCSVGRLARLWALSSWHLCEEASLLREALEYLKGAYRALQASTAWCSEHEEALFRMFCALDVSCLPVQALLSPWVPIQAQAVRCFVQQQPAESIHLSLQKEVMGVSEKVRQVGLQCSKMSNRLNTVEQRTVVTKIQINDTLIGLEEHQRKQLVNVSRSPSPLQE